MVFENPLLRKLLPGILNSQIKEKCNGKGYGVKLRLNYYDTLRNSISDVQLLLIFEHLYVNERRFPD